MDLKRAALLLLAVHAVELDSSLLGMVEYGGVTTGGREPMSVGMSEKSRRGGNDPMSDDLRESRPGSGGGANELEKVIGGSVQASSALVEAVPSRPVAPLARMLATGELKPGTSSAHGVMPPSAGYLWTTPAVPFGVRARGMSTDNLESSAFDMGKVHDGSDLAFKSNAASSLVETVSPLAFEEVAAPSSWNGYHLVR